jgi:hypothetical protein
MRGRAADRYVTVKGVAERQVKADLALWPHHVVTTGDDLAAVQARIAQNVSQVRAFLRRQGIDTAQIELQAPEVTDTRANPYGGERATAPRYIVGQTVTVRSPEVDLVMRSSGRVGELLTAGIVLSSRMDFGRSGPTYLFTRLNDLKPAMIAEATASAREAAAQFATDSRSRLGGIRQANQGVFVILPRDQSQGVMEETQPFKTVRVVATVEYYLRD